MEILIIQTAFIGDITLSLFLANELKQRFPDSKISFISTEIGYEILKCFKFIDYPIIFSKRNKHKGLRGIKSLVTELNDTTYNYIFALHRSFRTAILVNQISSNEKVGFDRSSFSFLLTKRIKYNRFLHEICRNRRFLSIFSTFSEDFDYLKCVEKNISDFNFITNVVETTFTKPILIAPGSVWETKKWNKDYFIDLSIKLKNNGENVYLIGGEKDVNDCNYIAQKAEIFDLSGRTSIPQILELVRNSKLLITNDSAPTHFASLFNIPTITIYGATTHRFGFSPLAINSTIIECESLFCHPCSIHGGRKCPRNNMKCMKNITPEMIYKKYLSILQN